MNVKDLKKMLEPSGEDAGIVKQLVQMFDNYQGCRGAWDTEIDEIADFLFATDTKSTSNSKLPFHNTTTVPKLAHIRNNLIVSYASQIMPSSQWIAFSGDSAENDSKEIRQVVQGYVRTKAQLSNLEVCILRLIQDWVDTGVCCVQTRYVKRFQPSIAGANVPTYSGPQAIRIDPRTVFWDATATDIESACKVVKQIMSLGDLKQEASSTGGMLSPEQFEDIRNDYAQFNAGLHGGSTETLLRNFQKAGFGDMLQYFTEKQVEILTFYGTFYDFETDTLYENHKVVICNRKWLLSAEPADKWGEKGNIHISIYEHRRDNLIPMSPLARVVGMQYKIDKLENLRADVFDRIANPPIVEIGDVEFTGVRGAPGSRYRVTEGGDVKELTSASPVLNADMQIANTMSMMDDLTHNPRESLGTRTPGEKTKFEVQILDQGQNRMFRYNARRYEAEIVNPILNDFLNLGRKNLDAGDIIEVFSGDTIKVSEFMNITKESLTTGGKMKALGSSIMAEKANMLQSLATITNSGLWPALNPHTSRIKLARLVEFLGDFDNFDLFMQNIGVQEDAETQQIAQRSMDAKKEAALTDSRITEEGQ